MIRIVYTPSFPRKLRNAEHYDMFGHIRTKLLTMQFKTASLAAQVNSFLQTFSNEEVIYKRYVRKADTRQVKKTHSARHKGLMAFKRTLEAASYSLNPQIKEAADAILLILGNYGDAFRAPMTEVTALVSNMILDLKLPKYAASIALLPGVEDAIDRMEQENKDFNDIYVERTDLEEDMKEEGSLYEARMKTDHSFASLVEAFNVLYRLNEMQHPKDPDVSAVLGEIIHFINSFLHRYESIYSRRNPKTPSDDSNKPSTPDEDVPGDTIPELTFSAQVIVADNRMALRADAIILAILYPASEDGAVRIFSPETETFVDFPVAGIETDTDGLTIGLLVDPPAANETFDKPFFGFGVAEADIVNKDGTILALLQGLQYPSMTREG
ncbi:MAG: DUF6261 family protein [Tannerellaceae bacterium]|jgi:hypothetical protein|nr:DUF6261 family protein [Tannerellaceae bacterium]